MNEDNPGLDARIQALLWPSNPVSYLRRLLLRALRLVYATGKDLLAGGLTLRAMSLVYTTLLSIVPLLALSFSVLKALGVHNQIEPYLFQMLAPLGEQGIQIGNHLIDSIDNMKVGVLGSMGLGLLVYTVLSLVQKIETTFNMVWHVNNTRSLGERFSSYLSVILIGPVLMVSALGMTATVMSSSVVQYFLAIEPFGSLIVAATKLMPYFMVIGVFTFIYMFVPNTRVRIRPALCGAIVAGFMWQTSGLLFASFVVGSAKYTAIYSSFAIVILLLIWLYLSWLILLFGSTIAFYIQNPTYMRVDRHRYHLSSRVKEQLALMIMQKIGVEHYRQGKGLAKDDLVLDLQTPNVALSHVLNSLVGAGLLAETCGNPPRYIPARPLDTLKVSEVLHTIRWSDESNYLRPQMLSADQPIRQVLDKVRDAVDSALEGQTIKSMVQTAEESGETVPLASEKPKD